MTISATPSDDAAAAPLTVIFSFLSRADSTPLDQRSRADGHILDERGNMIADPAAEPAASAFAPNTNLNFEQWGDYWRKVHGVRFLHPDDAGDQASIDRLLRYDQIHRIAPGPTNFDTMPYAPPLDASGHLFDTIIGHVEKYCRPRWDGVAYLNFADLEDVGVVLGTERVRRKILPEDRAIFRDIAPLLARQFIILPNSTGDDAIALVKTHIRRADIDRETFQHRWLHDHARFVVGQVETQRLVKRYVQLHNIGPVEEGAGLFHPATSNIDGVTLMIFASMKDVETFLVSDEYREIERAEQSISIVEAVEYWTGLTYTIVDQLRPERVSRIA